MARIIVSAVADRWYANAQSGHQAGVGITVSVTDENGVPYTSLEQRNFHVQLNFDPASVMEPKVWDFVEYKKTFPQHSLGGVYMFALAGVNHWWSAFATYTCVIAVKEDKNHGHTILTFRVPAS
jgi:hypothetical protein